MQRKRAPTFSGPEGDAIRKWVEKQTKGYFLDQLVDWFHVAFLHRVVDKSTMCRWVKYQGLTRKKGTVKPLQQSQHRIDQFWNLLQANGVRAHHCAWMDEMGFLSGQDMRCVYGYSAQGKKFRVTEKLGKGRRYDMLTCMLGQVLRGGSAGLQADMSCLWISLGFWQGLVALRPSVWLWSLQRRRCRSDFVVLDPRNCQKQHV